MKFVPQPLSAMLAASVVTQYVLLIIFFLVGMDNSVVSGACPRFEHEARAASAKAE
jgi:hypothetical protein